MTRKEEATAAVAFDRRLVALHAEQGSLAQRDDWLGIEGVELLDPCFTGFAHVR